jgi:hypothetical protein
MPLAGPRSMKMVVGAKTLLISAFAVSQGEKNFVPVGKGAPRLLRQGVYYHLPAMP